MGRRSADPERRHWLEAPGAVQRVAELVGCTPEQVTDARVERTTVTGPLVLVATISRPISDRDAHVLQHGVMVS